MFCSSCGKEITDSANFCEKCGRQVNGLGSPGAMQPQPYQTAYQGGQYRPPMRGAIPDIPNHLGWAIVSLILFWPTGIPAIVYSTRVDNRIMLGDMAGAYESSRKARVFSIISTVVPAVIFVIYLLFIISLAWWFEL